MPWTVGAFNEDRAAAVTTFDALAAVDDDHLRVSGVDMYVPDELANVFGIVVAHGTGTAKGSPTRARYVSPSLLGLIIPEVDALSDTLDGYHKHVENLAAAYTQNVDTDYELAQPYQHLLFPENPIALRATEALNVELTNGAAAGARGLALVFFTSAPLAPRGGDIRTVRGTTSFTPVANQWSSGAITLDQDLPVGTYAVVGTKVVGGDTYGFFRLIFTGYTWRPGGVIVRDVRQEVSRLFRRGGLGVWGSFRHDQPPRLEVLEVAAVANPVVYLDLIKLS